MTKIFDVWHEIDGKKIFFCQHINEQAAKYDCDFFNGRNTKTYYTERRPEEEKAIRDKR